MHQVSVVHVLDSHQGLIEELEGLDLIKPLELVEVVEEIAVFGIVQHQVDELTVLEHFVELDDVLVL